MLITDQELTQETVTDAVYTVFNSAFVTFVKLKGRATVATAKSER